MRPFLWPTDMILRMRVTNEWIPERGKSASTSWGKTDKKLLPSINPWPNRIVKFIGMGLLICKWKRAILIIDGSMTRLTLTLAPMGMVAPWRCQEHRRPSSLIHWAWSQNTKTEIMQTDSDLRLRLTIIIKPNWVKTWLKQDWQTGKMLIIELIHQTYSNCSIHRLIKWNGTTNATM